MRVCELAKPEVEVEVKVAIELELASSASGDQPLKAFASIRRFHASRQLGHYIESIKSFKALEKQQQQQQRT